MDMSKKTSMVFMNLLYILFLKSNFRSKRQYPPLSLQTLQLMIDTNRIDPSKPIDLAAVCNTKAFHLDPSLRHFGINLTDEGKICVIMTDNAKI